MAVKPSSNTKAKSLNEELRALLELTSEPSSTCVEGEEVFPTFFSPLETLVEGNDDNEEIPTTSTNPANQQKRPKKVKGIFKSIGQRISLKMSGYPSIILRGSKTFTHISDLTDAHHHVQEVECDTDNSSSGSGDEEIHNIEQKESNNKIKKVEGKAEQELKTNTKKNEEDFQQLPETTNTKSMNTKVRSLIPTKWLKGTKETEDIKKKNGKTKFFGKTKKKKTGDGDASKKSDSEVTYGQILGNLDAFLEANEMDVKTILQRERSIATSQMIVEARREVETMRKAKREGSPFSNKENPSNQEEDSLKRRQPMTRSTTKSLDPPGSVADEEIFSQDDDDDSLLRATVPSTTDILKHYQSRVVETIKETETEAETEIPAPAPTPTPSVGNLSQFLDGLPKIRLLISQAQQAQQDDDDKDDNATLDDSLLQDTMTKEIDGDATLDSFILANSIIESKGLSSSDSEEEGSLSTRDSCRLNRYDMDAEFRFEDGDPHHEMRWEGTGHTRDSTLFDKVPGIPLCRSFTAACCSPLEV